MILTLLAVCRNEANTGHLEDFLKWNVPLFDNVIVYDDASSDKTVEHLKSSEIKVIENEISMFRNELLIRENLLNEAKLRFTNTDWFMILDLDEILTCTREELENLIQKAEDKKCEGISFRLVNLWKSNIFYRTDEYFDKVTKVHLWKNKDEMFFSGETGLHRELHPVSIKTIYSQEILRILHLGFSTRQKIVQKFNSYKKLGQGGRSLWRLIDERYMQVESLDAINESLGLKISEWVSKADISKPQPTEVAHYLWEARMLEINRDSSPEQPLVTLVCLIYSGVDWLEFAYGELLLLQNEFDAGQVDILFCANDASQEVLDFLLSNNIPFIELNNEDSNEYYISRVYRAYNFATRHTKSKFCLLVNSDMAYAPGFLTKMLLERDEESFVVARLVESGTLKPGPLAIKRNFGKSLKKFKRKRFYKFAMKQEERGMKEGGLYMPLLISREKFLGFNGFPEGNLTPGSLTSYLNTGNYDVASPGSPCISGDAALFKRAQIEGIKHSTSLRAIAYHFQEGEKRHANDKRNERVRSGFAVANDSLDGINKERVLWHVLVELLERNRILLFQWNTGKITFPIVYFRKIARLRFKVSSNPRVCLQNATYLPIVDPKARTLALLQDNVFSPRLVALQKKVLDSSQTIITNSVNLIDLNSKNHIVWQPLPISDIFFETPQTAQRIPNNCIFVGAFDDTKGWPEVRETIIANPGISFNLVSKYDYDNIENLEEFPNNVTIHRKINQLELIHLYDQATYFILGSPQETQCLAAIEAASRGVIIIMKETGLLAESPFADQFGYFGFDLKAEMTRAVESKQKSNDTRSILTKMRLSNSDLNAEWEDMLLQELRKSFEPNHRTKLTLTERIMRKIKAPKLVKPSA